MNSAAEHRRRMPSESEAILNALPNPVLLIAPDGRRAWVSCTEADVVAVLDLAALTVVGRWKAGREPDGLAGAFVPTPR